jgi:hypothetical protein
LIYRDLAARAVATNHYTNFAHLKPPAIRVRFLRTPLRPAL